MKLRREGLRHLHVDPNRIHVGDLEQLLTRAPTGTDQSADIGIARRDDAVERTTIVLNVSIASSCRTLAGPHRQRPSLLPRRLSHCPRPAATRLASSPKIPTLGGDGRKFRTGLGTSQRGFGLSELLVEVGCINHREHLAGLHRRADIKLPTLQIAVDPRVDAALR